MTYPQKQTKIVATIGPASESYESLQALSEAGVNVFRLNFSHGTHPWHAEVIKRIKRLNQKSPQNLAILLDTKGPEIRSGDLKSPIILENNQEVILSVAPNISYEKDKKISVNYEGFFDDVEEGETILIEGGVMTLKVLKKDHPDITCQVIEGGELTSRRHLNIPGKDVSLESITKKDWEDIKFGVEMGVDFIALSFVRGAKEIYQLKDYLQKEKAHIKVIAKIESFEAMRHTGTITEAADALMVARGDLGAEIPFSQVPQAQQELISAAAKFKKPVIVATQMLESMMENPIPTRAEVSDVSQAVLQNTDAVMLSGETAGGKYPLKTVQTMTEIIQESEKILKKNPQIRPLEAIDDRELFSKLAAEISLEKNDIDAIVVITRSGYMANLISSFRPHVPILAFTNETTARRQMQLCYGVKAYRIEFSQDPQTTIQRAKESYLRQNPKAKGKRFILTSDFLVDGEFSPTLQIREF